MPLADPTPPTIPSVPTRLPAPVIALALFGAALLAYLPSIKGGLLWDDAAHITAPALQTWHGLWRASPSRPPSAAAEFTASGRAAP